MRARAANVKVNDSKLRPLIVADAEVLHLAVAEIAASHDVELARDAARDVLGVQLRLASVDLLEPSVDGVSSEVTHEVAVAAKGADHMLLKRD